MYAIFISVAVTGVLPILITKSHRYVQMENLQRMKYVLLAGIKKTITLRRLKQNE